MKTKISLNPLSGKTDGGCDPRELHHDAYPTVWDQMLFLPSAYSIDVLLKAVAENHSASSCSPDDVAKIRGRCSRPAGQCSFEAALLMGEHGRDRCFLVQPRNHPGFTLPTDLAGVVPATYDDHGQT